MGAGAGRAFRLPIAQVNAQSAAAVIAIDCASAEAEVAAIRPKTSAAQKKQAAAREKALSIIFQLRALAVIRQFFQVAEPTEQNRNCSRSKHRQARVHRVWLQSNGP
jgi:hypothetical protein